MYQDEVSSASPACIFTHVFGEDVGWVVTFTGRQATLDNPGARRNELTEIEQRSWAYPASICKAQKYLRWQSEKGRDAYFGVHLYREPGNRLSSNSMPTVSCLWLDEDEGFWLDVWPEPTAIVLSSKKRRHYYWRLTQPVAVEWAVEMNKRIAYLAGGDAGKAGLATVLRAPGTWNYKRHPVIDPVVGSIEDVAPWSPVALEQAIPPLPDPKRPRASTPVVVRVADLAEYLPLAEVLYETPDGLSGTKYAIVCPWIHEHTGGDRSGTYVGQRIDGGPWFHCNHAHCQGRVWREFKRALMPRKRKILTNHPVEVNITYEQR